MMSFDSKVKENKKADWVRPFVTLTYGFFGVFLLLKCCWWRSMADSVPTTETEPCLSIVSVHLIISPSNFSRVQLNTPGGELAVL